MKKILLIGNIKFLFCSNTEADTQQHDVKISSNELYNLIEEIEYDDLIFSHDTNLSWLPENISTMQEQTYKENTSQCASDNTVFGNEHGCELEAGYKRKSIIENGNSCNNPFQKRQKTVQHDINTDLNCQKEHMRIKEPDKSYKIVQSENNFRYSKNEIIVDYENINIHPTDLTFFNALVSLIRNIIYYRFNISKFFCVFNLKLDKYYNTSDYLLTKDTKIGKMINLFIQFAEKNINKICPDFVFDTKKAFAECKIHESNYLKLLNTNPQESVLYNSKEYKKLKAYNHEYLIFFNNTLNKSEVRELSMFLKTVFVNSLKVHKYYNMLADFLGSLYAISLLINGNLSKIQNLIDVDKRLFAVKSCTCSQKTKDNFIFHWVICWITYFSKNFFTLKASTNHGSLVQSNTFPKKFLIQCIILLHYNMGCDNNDYSEKQLDKNDINYLQATIIELLYSRIDGEDLNFLQHILFNYYDEIKDPHSDSISVQYTLINIRMQKTSQEHRSLSNKLVSSIEKLTKVLFGVTKQAFRLAKTKTNKKT